MAELLADGPDEFVVTGSTTDEQNPARAGGHLLDTPHHVASDDDPLGRETPTAPFRTGEPRRERQQATGS